MSGRRAPAPSRARSPMAAAATAPTVTDANLVLGRLDPAFFLGGPCRWISRPPRAAPCPARRGPVPLGRGRGARRHPHGGREHGQRHPPDRGGARPRHPRLRAHRLRRRRPAPRPLRRRTAGHDQRASCRPIPASARPSVRRSPRPGSIACRRSSPAPTMSMSPHWPRRSSACAAAPSRSCGAASMWRRRRSAARPICATPARTTSSRSQLPEGELDAAGWQALMDRFAEAHATAIRLRAARRAGRADQSAGDGAAARAGARFHRPQPRRRACGNGAPGLVRIRPRSRTVRSSIARACSPARR